MNIAYSGHSPPTINPPKNVRKGEVYFDMSSSTQFVYDGTTWVQLKKNITDFIEFDFDHLTDCLDAIMDMTAGQWLNFWNDVYLNVRNSIHYPHFSHLYRDDIIILDVFEAPRINYKISIRDAGSRIIHFTVIDSDDQSIMDFHRFFATIDYYAQMMKGYW